MRLPQKRSLVKETYDVLLEAIQNGTWQEYIPGERHLCERFQISRLTLRQALKHLENEGILKVEQGKRRKISKQAQKKTGNKEDRWVGYLCSIPSLEMPGYISRSFAIVERILHQASIGMQIMAKPGCFTKAPEKALQQLLEDTNINFWILTQAPREIQQWFYENKVPALLSGTPYPGLDLPFVDLDNAAVCRHAVGRLISKKRRRICFLAESKIFAGDERSEIGFKEGIKANSHVEGRVVRCDGTPRGVVKKLNMLMKSKNPPDGFLVDKSSHAYTVISYMQKNGVRVPEDISVICRTESIDFRYMVPTIAHYSRNIPEVAKRTAELTMKLVSGEMVESKGIYLIPDFVAGDSL